jgi:DNA polymerase III epsilon subunit-like protein
VTPLFSVFDTETTGLTAHPEADLKLQPRTIEFAGLLTDGVDIIDTVEFILNPGIAIEEIITKITGLTNADLEDKPDMEQYIGAMADFFGRSKYCIAHNASFDKSILKYDLERRGKVLADINFPKPICTVEQTFQQFGRRMKLQELYELYFGPYEQKHRALDDVILLHKVCQRIGLYKSLGGRACDE